MPNTRSRASRTREAINKQSDRQMAEALRVRNVVRNLRPLMGDEVEQEEVGGNGNGRNGYRGNGNGGNEDGGNGNGGNGNGNGNEGEYGYNFRGFMPARECTYQDFLKEVPSEVCFVHASEQCIDLVELPQENDWNEAAYAMSWVELMKLMTEELILLCTRMVPNEEDKVERFIGGQPNNIQGNGYAARSAESKRRMESNPRDNRGQQPLFKSALLDVAPSTLDTSYAVELADGRISETNVVLRGCTLGLLGHPFDIDLMPVELGSFDVIIGIDWLAKYHALIVCDVKVVRIPYGDEVLIIRGNNYDGGSKLNIISCTRTQKYIEKGCQVYLAQVTSKKAEDKSEEKRLEELPIVREFPEVFRRLAWTATCSTS
ncbi:putative reverse transcriptase domain-containing protein [Tanacetum coccineum]